MRGAGFWQRHALARGSILGELRSFVGHCSLRGVSMAAQQGERSKVAMPNDIAYSRKLGPLTPLDDHWCVYQLSHKVKQPSRSEEHTSELQSLMRISYAVFCLKKKKYANDTHNTQIQ